MKQNCLYMILINNLLIQYVFILLVNGKSSNDGYIYFYRVYGVDTPFYIRDAKVPLISLVNVEDYAKLTCPKEIVYISESTLPDAGLGVFAARRIEEGTYFGPYVGEKIRNTLDDGSYAWTIYNDFGEFLYYVDAFDQVKSNWLRFINCPNADYQQNLVTIEYDKNVYYQALRDIEIGEELLVYYGDVYARYLGINTTQLFEYPERVLKSIN